MRKNDYIEVKQQAIKKKKGSTLKSKMKFKDFLRKMTMKIQPHKNP